MAAEGHVSRRETKTGGVRWDARYPLGNGKFRTKTFVKKVDAQRRLREWANEADRGGTSFSNAATRMTVSEYAEGEWFPHAKSWAPATHVRRLSAYTHHIKPTLGDRRLQALTHKELTQWVSGLDAAPTTAKVIHATLRLMLNAAVKDGVLVTNHAAGIRTPRDNRAKGSVLSHEEVRALIDAAPAEYRAAFIVAAYCGLRVSEVAGLKKSDLTFLKRQPTLRVERQVYCPDGSAPVLAPPKTARSTRTIPMPAAVVEALSAHLAHVDLGEGETLFHRDGKLIHRTEMTRVMAKARKTAGITRSGEAWHALRHYYATTLAAAGVNLTTVAARLGDSVQTTVATYLHVCPSDDDRIVSVLDSVVSEAAARSSRDGRRLTAL